MLNRRRNARRRADGRLRAWLAALPPLPALPWRRLGVAAASLAGVALAGAGLLALLDQPITEVQVAGRLQHLAAADVEQAVRARLHGAGLVRVRLDVLGSAVRALPWVDTVSIERRWPHGLVVRVGEQRAVAYWNGTGLVNAHGELFRSDARYAAPELAQLAGPAGTEGEVVARYLALAGRVASAGMRLTSLQLDQRGAWTLGLDDGVTVRIGRKQVDERMARFGDVVLRLLAQPQVAHEIEYVDLRYSNGFAVGRRGAAGHGEGEGNTHG